MVVRTLETLESLIEYNAQLVLTEYQNNRTLNNVIVGYTPDNRQKICFNYTFSDSSEKKHILEMIRLCFIAYNVDKYVVMGETWCATYASKDEIKKNNNLELHPGKIECLMILAVNRLGKKTRMFKINGDKTLERWLDFDTKNDISGDLVGLLPQIKLTDYERKNLMNILKQHGYYNQVSSVSK